MSATTEFMARKPKKPTEAEQPKAPPSVQVRIPGEVYQALEAVARKEWTSVATQLVFAAQMYLAHKGYPVPER